MPPHAGFIIAAYAVTAAVLLATVAVVVLDYQAQRRAVERLSGRLAREDARDDMP